MDPAYSLARSELYSRENPFSVEVSRCDFREAITVFSVVHHVVSRTYQGPKSSPAHLSLLELSKIS